MPRPQGIDPQVYASALQAYKQLNDSPMQQKLRQERAFYCAAVYWQPGDYDRGHIVNELKRMKETGFTAVRFHTATPEWNEEKQEIDFTRADDWLSMAAEVGIDVIYHGAIRKIPAGFLKKQGVDPNAYQRSDLSEPEMLAALRAWAKPVMEHLDQYDFIIAQELEGEPGPIRASVEHPDEQKKFAAWLEQQYGNLEAINQAWALYPEKERPLLASFEDVWRELEGFKASEVISGVHRAKMNYAAGRDALRYLTEKTLRRLRVIYKVFREYRGGGIAQVGMHQFFLNQASMCWDFGEWARLADCHFCSLHLPWHFELVEGKVDRPVAMQAKLTRDYFKHGMTSCFETIGGAVQYSGGYGSGMTEGLMRRHILSYLGTGNLAMAFWTWNHRPGGWESGEYGLTSLSGEITPWAKEIGKVSRLAQQYIDELWEAEHQPAIALMDVWDTDAILNFEPQRHELLESGPKLARGTIFQAQRARIGAARALLNHHVPFEYATTHELKEGISCVYPTIYFPHARAVNPELLPLLKEHVEQGGRLVVDVQFAFQDHHGKVQPRGKGSALEQLFGGYVDVIHDARTTPVQVDGIEVEGFFGDVVATDAKPISWFSDGRIAATEHRLGRGSAVIIGFDPARQAHKKDHAPEMKQWLTRLLMQGRPMPWRANSPLAFRRTTEKADHYFLLNEGPARTVWIQADDASYSSGVELMSGEPLAVDRTIVVRVPEASGVWVRLEK